MKTTSDAQTIQCDEWVFICHLAEDTSFAFLKDEPDIYTDKDGEKLNLGEASNG